MRDLILILCIRWTKQGHYKEYNNNRVSEDDEGYEQEEEDMISIDKAIEVTLFYFFSQLFEQKKNLVLELV